MKNGILKATSAKRYCSVPGCIFLGAADIGKARVGRKTMWVTWGRNLPSATAAAVLARGFQPISIGADDGSFELLIPEAVAATICRSL